MARIKLSELRNIVIFDGNCSVCCSFKRLAQRYDRKRRLSFFPYQKLDFDAIDHPDITLENAQKAVIFLDDKINVFTSGKAVAEILKKLTRPFGFVGRLISIYPVISLTELGYRMVAGNRDTIGKIFRMEKVRDYCADNKA